MGSWNETCALTRLAIQEHDPVVIYRAYTMGEYEARHENGDVPLIMGFHSFGSYTDCSEYKFDNDGATVSNRSMIDYAETHNEVWRAVDVVDDRNQTQRLFVAKDVEQFDRSICMSFRTWAKPADDFNAWTKHIKAQAQEWLDRVHAAINTQVPVTPETLYDILDEANSQVFKSDAPIWKLMLDSNDLWVGSAYELPIHRSAFESMVQNMTTKENDPREKMFDRFNAWREQDAEAQKFASEHPDLKWGKGQFRPGENMWAPLTRPRRMSTTPLHANFWDTVEPEDILQSIGFRHALQNNVFSYALLHTRASLVPGIHGSQNANMTFLADATNAVVNASSLTPTMVSNSVTP